MDALELFITIVIVVLLFRNAFKKERMYQALKSSGAYEGRVGLFSWMLEFRRGYNQAREDFIREQENNR